MGQKKLKRFAEIASFDHVMEYPENMAGKWHKHFGNSNPIVLELACGKGEYSIGLAAMHPDKNFVGVDVKGNRIWVGAKKALSEGLKNVAFLRSQIGMIEKYFAAGEVSEIWLPFPDPQLRRSKSKKRLTHPQFLRKYQQFLQQDGYIHLKTDSPVLFAFTKTVINLYGLQLFEESDDISRDLKQNPELLIKTHYEGLNIAGSNRIHYLKFVLTGELKIENDEKLAEIVRETETGEKEGATTDEEETD
ncbi:MAG: tRNA (guanosine(46)-N7)-methyltransferase TrmB [Chitinophagia bacterium]|jgi:tRNA (guanine-N7-)-methyltransferase